MAAEPSAISSHRRNRDAEILEAATVVFSQRGYSAASLQEIADRVGILKGSLYHYIDSKESLLFRILDGSHTSVQETMLQVDALSLPTELKFVTYVEHVVNWYLQHLDRAGLYQNEWRYLDGDFAKEVRVHRRNFSAYMRAMVDAAVDEGIALPDLDAENATRFVLSAIDSIPSWFRMKPPANPDDFAKQIARIAHSTIFGSREMPTS